MGPKPTSKAPSKSAKPPKTKAKSSKQPPPPAERLKRLFTSLCAQIDGGYFTNAIKTCDKILRIDPNDRDAIQTKLFLLLQTDQYLSALTLIDANENYSFEKAYTLYRLQREDEVQEALIALKEKDEETDRGVIHLEAQLHYRQGSYEAAFNIYNDLLDSAEPDTEEHSDILTNLEAAQRQLDFINSGYLRSLDTLPNSLTTTLESNPPPALPHTSSVLANISSGSQTQTKAGEELPKKKVRAKRVPNGVVPGVTPPPDPERWLKKSERSTFHTGHKKRKGAGGGATQGIVETPGSASNASGLGSGAGKGKGKKKK
ncbi:hypothetical protein C8Q75DRAFT_488327 [Abortiporus biennis]|nr:hypothetical protein C8Q75DRAFT_488327 [Abortiporus biennis]